MSIYELNNFLENNDCDNYINLINDNKNNIPFTDSGKFINNKWTNLELATLFYNKLQTYKINDNILRPNNLVMSGKFNVGDVFSLHTDTGLYYNRDQLEETRWTLLIYLNDDFEGGNTVFYDDKWSINKIIKPKKGNAILFDIDLWHKADKIIKGTKYWIGCEIIGKILRQL